MGETEVARAWFPGAVGGLPLQAEGLSPLPPSGSPPGLPRVVESMVLSVADRGLGGRWSDRCQDVPGSWLRSGARAGRQGLPSPTGCSSKAGLGSLAGLSHLGPHFLLGCSCPASPHGLGDSALSPGSLSPLSGCPGPAWGGDGAALRQAPQAQGLQRGWSWLGPGGAGSPMPGAVLELPGARPLMGTVGGG